MTMRKYTKPSPSLGLSGAASAPSVRLNAGEHITLRAYKVTGGSHSFTGRVIVTKIADL